ncbi:MAG: RDD family protein [Thermoflexus sp.]|jgi:uncharacterized RDD family membrane protein YckC|nr:RDD family protein [Thermoflexus sp.]MDT7884867.1 RDD family protein [Thermoflexus sp.]MDT7947758.1 RDD family protein [Thermoflexus sp.]
MEARRFELASPFRRLMAQLIEYLIGLAAYGVLFPMGLLGALIGQDSQEAQAVIGGLGLLLLCGVFLILVGLQLYLWSQGMSIGKWILSMQVVREDGRPAGFGTMLVRELIGKTLSSIVFYLGFIWVLLDREHQGWHDKLVRTWVVLKRS